MDDLVALAEAGVPPKRYNVKLTTADRKCLLALHLCGYSDVVLSQTFGVSVSAVRSMRGGIKRGYEKLRNEFNDTEPEEYKRKYLIRSWVEKATEIARAKETRTHVAPSMPMGNKDQFRGRWIIYDIDVDIRYGVAPDGSVPAWHAVVLEGDLMHWSNPCTTSEAALERGIIGARMVAMDIVGAEDWWRRFGEDIDTDQRKKSNWRRYNPILDQHRPEFPI